MPRVTYILPDGTKTVVDVRLADAPFDDHGKPASLLALALKSGVFLDHACGGVSACSTCHVIVERGGETLSPAAEKEEDMLDMAPGLTARSRLACQAEMLADGSEIVARIPPINRNLVSEHK
jgi:2Fe-2S ferredoxin